MYLKSYIFFILLLLGASCNTLKQEPAEEEKPKEIITLDGHTFEAFAGPNLVRIDSNFYADATEVTNAFYKEFIYWMKTVYGVKSDEFLSILPDLSVWNFQNHLKVDGSEYFTSPDFDDYPVVGITLEQAKKYADWRTERVAEMLLIEQGYVNPYLDPSEPNHFTIERFKTGNYNRRKKIKTNFVYCRFTVPTLEEWNALSGISKDFKYGIDSENKDNMEFIYNGNSAFHTLENLNAKVDKAWYDEEHDFKPSLTMPSYYGITNIHGLYQTIGNVSEMIDEVGKAQGGDWKHRLTEIDKLQSIKQNIPNCWTGFRCVSKFEVIKYQEPTKDKK